MRIGVDFDNTIASYEHVFPSAAIAMGLLPHDFNGGKAETKAALEGRRSGENDWQRLQGQVYGVYMPQARLMCGVSAFLTIARAKKAKVIVVSHKTKHGHFDTARVDLREAALNWMSQKAFFDPNGFGLACDDVHFLPTRAEKVKQIAKLALDVFIDDLPAVLSEPGFPVGTRRILYRNNRAPIAGPFEAFSDWFAIRKSVFFS